MRKEVVGMFKGYFGMNSGCCGDDQVMVYEMNR
jgi:hypothetical protein